MGNIYTDLCANFSSQLFLPVKTIPKKCAHSGEKDCGFELYIQPQELMICPEMVQPGTGEIDPLESHLWRIESSGVVGIPPINRTGKRACWGHRSPHIFFCLSEKCLAEK